MKKALLVIAWCVLSGSASAEQVVRSISWAALAEAGELPSGTLAPPADGGSQPGLRIVHDEDAPATFHLITLERPGIAADRYALRGQVRHEGVRGTGYLEMWSHLPEGTFFTRSLGDSGPMQHLQGSSGWRAFLLPFFNREGGSPPVKLVVNLVLPGRGTVEIGPLDLVELEANENPFAVTGAWWDDRQAGLLGAVGGSALGILGAIVGWLGSTGRARGFVLGTLQWLAVAGVAGLVLGTFALLRGQPYAVYYPLLLVGGLCAVLGATLRGPIGKRYAEMELRRMQALDA